MLKVRVIPTLLLKNVGLVKGVGFDSWRRIGTLMPSVKVYNSREVDELILVDIAATAEGRPPDSDTVKDISSECFVPLTVGGGVKDIGDVRRLLLAGADKVCINTAAFADPEFIGAAARHFGSQCIVASIDAKKTADGRYECFSHSGTRRAGRGLLQWAREMERQGAGELLVTSVERDGTMEGYDLEMIALVARQVTVPVIASGGAGTYHHLFEAVSSAGASAVAAASMFHFTEQTPLGAKRYLAARGIPVRYAGVGL